jgi:hypothetical protein
MSKKNDTSSPLGSHGAKGPLRDWASASYSAKDGRAVSSLGDHDGRGSPSTTHAEHVSAQIPGGFERCDRERSQDPRPVHKRPFTERVD